jgi:hypothetical protein
MAQPNMGERKQYLFKPPPNVAQAFEKVLAADGRSRSVYVADLAAARYKLQQPSERFRTKTAVGRQATLPLGKSVRRRRRPEPAGGLYSTRLPLDVAAALDREVADAAAALERDAPGTGANYSARTFLTELLTQHLRDLRVLPRPAGQRKPSAAQANQQEVLPLSRAS